MALSAFTRMILTESLRNQPASDEIATAINTAGASSSATPIFTTLGCTGATTLTGAVTTIAGLTVGTTLAVGTTSTFTGAATFTADTTHNGHLLLATGKVLKVNNVQVVGAPAANIVTITTTYTTGAAPTPGSTQTISNSGTPTAVELLQYVANLEGKFNDLLAKLKTHGLVLST